MQNMTNQYKLQQALRAVHYAQGYVQALNTRSLTERQALNALDRAELAILDLKEKDHSHGLQ